MPVSFLHVRQDAISGAFSFTFGRDGSTGVVVDMADLAALLGEHPEGEDPPLFTPFEVAAAATLVAQMAWDARTPFEDIDPEDPDRLNDPNRPTAFWARVVPEEEIGRAQRRVDVWRPVSIVGGTATHVLERNTLVEIKWSGTRFFTQTRNPDIIQ